MEILAERWAGHVYGTNTGNLYLELKQTEGILTGFIRFNDSAHGLIVYDAQGSFDDRLRLEGKPQNLVDGLDLGEISMNAALTPEGNLRGEWHSSIGTAGTFTAYPHYIDPNENNTLAKEAIPEQVYFNTKKIGAVRLLKDDLKRLVETIKDDFSEGKVIVTFINRGIVVSKFFDDFIRDAGIIKNLKYIKIHIKESEGYGFNRIVNVELKEKGHNEIKVTGSNESWVLGKAESVRMALKRCENKLVSLYKKLVSYPTIFILMLILLPEIDSVLHRSYFLGVIIIFLAFITAIHRRYIPNALVLLAEDKNLFLKIVWPNVLNFILMVTSSVLAAWIFLELKNSTSP